MLYRMQPEVLKVRVYVGVQISAGLVGVDRTMDTRTHSYPEEAIH
jgi:hypothetical protein